MRLCAILLHFTISILIVKFFKGAIPELILFIFVFAMQFTVNKCLIEKFADDCNRTVDLCYMKLPLCQLSHNHCPFR